MHIKIAARLRPFSHIPGTYCVLPGTTLRLQIFPALIRVHDLSQSEPKWMAEIPVPVKGPVKEFTAQLDLEKAIIHIWGKGEEGYFRYRISSAQYPYHLAMEIDKGLQSWSPEIEAQPFKIQQHLPKVTEAPLTDRLSLGSHKSQDWDQVKRRGDLCEILPAWLRLGQLIDAPAVTSWEGASSLLKICQNSSSMEAYSAFQNLFYVAFDGILSPRLRDDQYQGFDLTPAPSAMSPLILLKEGAQAIRSLFFRMQDNDLFILPQLPSQFHSGRFLQVKCGRWGLLDFEWSKKMIRCMQLYAEESGSINMHFPKDVRCFRLNGQNYSVEKPIPVEKGHAYTFDRFQK